MPTTTTALTARFSEWEAQRACDGCMACCFVHAIVETMSPPYVWCRYCRGGCAIYDVRPAECRGYYCLWRMGFGTDEDRPDRNGMVVDFALDEGEAPVIAIWRPLEEQPGQLERAWGMASEFRRVLADVGAPAATIEVHAVPPTRMVRWEAQGRQ
jgi:hypothetical protein